jgi:hypothetical protein
MSLLLFYCFFKYKYNKLLNFLQCIRIEEKRIICFLSAFKLNKCIQGQNYDIINAQLELAVRITVLFSVEHYCELRSYRFSYRGH